MSTIIKKEKKQKAINISKRLERLAVAKMILASFLNFLNLFFISLIFLWIIIKFITLTRGQYIKYGLGTQNAGLCLSLVNKKDL